MAFRYGGAVGDFGCVAGLHVLLGAGNVENMEGEMREIKFRAWHPRGEGMFYFDWRNPDGALQMGRRLSFRELKIMQSTGLHDKNGKEIWEGDIVRVGRLASVIAFIHGCFCFSGLPLTHLSGVEMEVIGNEYENPERS